LAPPSRDDSCRTHLDSVQDVQDSSGIRRRAQFQQQVRVLPQPGQAGEELQVPGRIGRRHGQQKNEPHPPGTPCPPSHRSRRAPEGKSQLLHPAHPRMGKSQLRLHRGIG